MITHRLFITSWELGPKCSPQPWILRSQDTPDTQGFTSCSLTCLATFSLLRLYQEPRLQTTETQLSGDTISTPFAPCRTAFLVFVSASLHYTGDVLRAAAVSNSVLFSHIYGNNETVSIEYLLSRSLRSNEGNKHRGRSRLH
jgi:hypothetical protein